MKRRFALGDHGRSFATRSRASELTAEVFEGFPKDSLEIDLAGVSAMSPSFADGFFGRLVDRGYTLTFVNADPSLSSRVETVIRRRQKPLSASA